jgi:CspA family cold shock protein
LKENAGEEKRMKGVVKTFNPTKGYGFITGEDGKDVFFHYSELVMDGFKTTKPGDHVEYEVENSDRGPRAKHVVIK